jgi:hypothetical protein
MALLDQMAGCFPAEKPVERMGPLQPLPLPLLVRI